MTIKSKGKKKKIPRSRMEMAIQAHKMEEHKWILSEKTDKDIGKSAYLDWVQRYSRSCREWLKSMTDEEVEKEYNKVRQYLKDRFENFSLGNKNKPITE